jgi:hypothetical protein
MPRVTPTLEIRSVIERNALSAYRAIGVYDLRREEERA